MKKLLLVTLFLVASTMFANAQNDTILYIENYPNGGSFQICLDRYQEVSIYAETGCTGFWWLLFGEIYSYDNPLIIDSQSGFNREVYYYGCNIPECCIHIYFKEGRVPTSFAHNAWKHPGESLQLEAVGSDSLYYYSYHWSTGETTRTISVTEPGSYKCEITDACGTAIRTFNVKDNVEISLATCDLESNKNLVTWQTTPAQAQYIDHVIVKRDGLEVGTANYSEGSFLDAIGSDAASRTYTLIAIATDGTECPIVSYSKETIHMAYLTGMNNTIEVNWNIPTGYDLLGYNICEWNPNDGNLSVIDFVGASVTSYTCQTSQFDNGNIVIQGVENGKTESRLLSNRSWETVGLGEQSSAAFKVYPNPSNGTFTVEGTGILRIANVLGQEIITKEINGMETIELPQGIYFVQLNDVVRKIVVE